MSPRLEVSRSAEDGPSERGAGQGTSSNNEEEPSLGDIMKVMASLASKVEALDQNVRIMQQQQQQQQQQQSEAASLTSNEANTANEQPETNR